MNSKVLNKKSKNHQRKNKENKKDKLRETKRNNVDSVLCNLKKDLNDFNLLLGIEDYEYKPETVTSDQITLEKSQDNISVNDLRVIRKLNRDKLSKIFHFTNKEKGKKVSKLIEMRLHKENKDSYEQSIQNFKIFLNNLTFFPNTKRKINEAAEKETYDLIYDLFTT